MLGSSTSIASARVSNAQYAPTYRRQSHSPLPVVNQAPLRSAVVAQPVVFHMPLRMPRAEDGSRNFSRFASVGLHHE